MSDVRRITDPGAYTAALEALDKIIQKKATASTENRAPTVYLR